MSRGYRTGDAVAFRAEGKELSGVVMVVDAGGAVEVHGETSYDIMAGEGSDRVFYKHVVESDVLGPAPEAQK